MKKSLLAIVFAAASLPMTFAQTPAPATQSTPDQTSTAPVKKAKKTNKSAKHGTAKTTSDSKTGTSSTPQK
jgi:hypothetical protein